MWLTLCASMEAVVEQTTCKQPLLEHEGARSPHSQLRVCGLWAEGKQPCVALHWHILQEQTSANRCNVVFFHFFSFWELCRVDDHHKFSPIKVNIVLLASYVYLNVLARGRKFTAKSQRDAICCKMLLSFHEVITIPRVEWLAATKRLLFAWHNVLCSTAWPHMQMTGQGVKRWVWAWKIITQQQDVREGEDFGGWGWGRGRAAWYELQFHLKGNWYTAASTEVILTVKSFRVLSLCCMWIHIHNSGSVLSCNLNCKV